MNCTQKGYPDFKCRHYTGICQHLFDKTGKWIAKPTDFPRDKDYTIKTGGNKQGPAKPRDEKPANYKAVPPPATYTKKPTKRSVDVEDSESEPEPKKSKPSKKKKPVESDSSDSEVEQKKTKKKKKKQKTDDSDSEPETKKPRTDKESTETSITDANPKKKT